jgi:predicted peptidase
MRYRLFIIILAFAAFGCSNGVSEKEFPSQSVVVNGKEFKYRIYVPENRDPSKKIPVMLYLHGSGSRGDDNQAQLGGFSSFIPRDKERYNFAIVMPQCREGAFWAGEMAEQAVAALDQTVKELNGDEDRLYLFGYSMGGYGTWQVAVAHPGKFAALVPIAGGILPNGPVSDRDLAMLDPRVRAAAESPDPYEAFARGIGNTPVWIFHGGADDVVPVQGSRKMAETLKLTGNQNVKYTEFEGVGHGSLENAFRETALFEWLGKQRLAADR